jgi:hypothetical protein
MKKSLLFFALIVSALTQAQISLYEKIFYDPGFNVAQQYAIAPVSGTNRFLSAGAAQYSKGLLYELDSAGNMLWNKTYHYAATAYPSVNFHALVPAGDSAFAVTGHVNDTASSTFAAVLTRLKTNGDTLWCRMIQSSGHNLYGLALTETHDSGFAVCGYAYPVSGGPPYVKQFVARTDKNGNLGWLKLLHSGSQNEYLYSVRQTPDSGFVLCGQTSLLDGGSFTRLDKNGGLVWAKSYSTGGSPIYINDCAILKNGYLLSGSMQSVNVFIRVDQGGTILGVQSSISSGGGMGSANYPQPKLREQGTNRYFSVYGGCWGSMFYQVDSTGAMQSSQSLIINVADAQLAQDGGILIAGNGPMCGIKPINVTWDHIGLIKTDSSGNGSGTCNYSQAVQPVLVSVTASPVSYTITTTGTSGRAPLKQGTLAFTSQPGCVGATGDVAELREGELRIFPQPASGSVVIEVPQPCVLGIYTLTGVLVKTCRLTGLRTALDVHELGAGVYLLRSGKGAAHKLVITN